MADLDLSDVFVFAPKTDLHAHPLFNTRQILLQDKVSLSKLYNFMLPVTVRSFSLLQAYAYNYTLQSFKIRFDIRVPIKDFRLCIKWTHKQLTG